MKVNTWKIPQILDIILVSMLGLFVWNGQAGNIFFLISFVFFRLVISFSLLERKKSNWLPISLFSIWLLLSGVFAGNKSGLFLEQPAFDMAKVGMLMLGDTCMDRVGEFNELLADESKISELIVTGIFMFLYWAWILFYPIVSYVRQWRKKEFVDSVLWRGPKWLSGLLLLTAGGWIILMLTVSKSDIAIVSNLYPLAFAWCWGIISLKQIRISEPVVRFYVVYATLFFGTFLIGRETEYFLSLFGLVVASVIFYKVFSSQQAVPVVKKDLLLLVVAGFLFWYSQFYEDILRVLLQGVGLIILFVESCQWYRASTSKPLAVLLFAVMGFVIPILSIGYNPYAVVHARRLSKFDIYEYSYNGIVQIADGDCIGLRDRYMEILPCKYNRIELAVSPHKPYLKVKEGKVWGLYDMETQKMVIPPYFASIYPYDSHFLTLKMQDGSTYYYPLGKETCLERDSLLRNFVALPCSELLEGVDLPFDSTLNESDIDNAPVHSGIYHYLVSTAFTLLKREATPTEYWEWAEKSNRLVERLGNEHHLFMSDTSSVADQSVERINELLHQNAVGNQTEMNCLSRVYAFLELYRTLTMNQTLVGEFKDDAVLEEALKQEYTCWMEYYWSTYRFYRDCITGHDYYSALPLDLNGFLDGHAVQRRSILVEELSLFKTGELTTVVQADIALEQLEKYTYQMEKKGARTADVKALRESTLAWLQQRSRVASLLPADSRTSYEMLTRKVKQIIEHELKWMTDKVKVHEEA